jgi:hypothetical protein
LVHPGETTYETFLSSDALKKGDHSLVRYRFAENQRVQIPYYYPRNFQILVTPELKRSLESLEDDHHTWWFKSPTKLNRFESLLMLMDQPIYQLAFLWTNPQADTNTVEVFFEESHPEVFVPAQIKELTSGKPTIELFFSFSPFILISAVISFFIFIFFYSLSRTFSRSLINNPIIVIIFLVSIPFWSRYYARVDEILFRRSEEEKMIIGESFKPEWDASLAAHFSTGYLAQEYLASSEKFELDLTKSKFADSLKAIGINVNEGQYRTPKEALTAIESEASLQIKKLSTPQLEKIYSPLKELRDSSRYPLGSMENIYQEIRSEYLNRED